MRTLVDIFGEQNLSLWESTTAVTDHLVDWRRAADPQADRVGIYAVSDSTQLDAGGMQQLRNFLLADASWLLDSQTRHRPMPSHLLEMQSASGRGLFFFDRRGRQFGEITDAGTNHADLRADFSTLLDSWLNDGENQAKGD